MLDSIKNFVANSLPNSEEHYTKLKALVDEILDPISALSCGTGWGTFHGDRGDPLESKMILLGPACALSVTVSSRRDGKEAIVYLELIGYRRQSTSSGLCLSFPEVKDLKTKILTWLDCSEEEFVLDQASRREWKGRKCGKNTF